MSTANGQQTIIAPSILAADFAALAAEVEAISDAEWVHIDVMDGHFVPNLSFGALVAKSLIGKTEQFLDVHLMIEDPQRWVKEYTDFDNVTFHVEAAGGVEESVALARALRAAGTKAGVSIKPNTPVEPLLEHLAEFDLVLVMSVEPGFGGQKFMPEVLGKVRALRERIDAEGLDTLIEIDGGIGPETAAEAAEAGVDVYVAGSSVFGKEDRNQAIREIRAAAEANAGA